MATTSLRLPVEMTEQLTLQARARHLRYTSNVRSILERVARGGTPPEIPDITPNGWSESGGPSANGRTQAVRRRRYEAGTCRLRATVSRCGTLSSTTLATMPSTRCSALCTHGSSTVRLGVIWCLVEHAKRNNDGRERAHLVTAGWDDLDPDLLAGVRQVEGALAGQGQLCVSLIEAAGILPPATAYFSEPMPYVLGTGRQRAAGRLVRACARRWLAATWYSLNRTTGSRSGLSPSRRRIQASTPWLARW